MAKLDPEKRIKNNIKEMLTTFAKYYVHLPESQLKKDFLRFLSMIRSGRDIADVLVRLQDNLDDARKVTSTDSSGVISFWQKVKEVLKETYEKNVEIAKER